jgi:glycosyltransferase involved in cell wall biosynthesis
MAAGLTASVRRAVDISIVLPCLNERAAVAGCVRAALAAITQTGRAGEVVLVDNGCTDGSADIARTLGARVVVQPERGYGNACRAGLDTARGRYLVLGDADGSYDFAETQRFVDGLERGYDLVIGSRLRGTIRPGAMPSLHRYVGTPVLAVMLSRLFGVTVSDPNCGLRALTRDAYDRLALVTAGMEFASEMLARAGALGLAIHELPIEYRRRMGVSKLRPFRDGWNHVRALQRCHVNAVRSAWTTRLRAALDRTSPPA